MDQVISLVVLACVLGGLWVFWDFDRKKKRKKRREESLRQDESGTYYWVGLDGAPQSSQLRPDRKGGDWEREDAERSSPDFGEGGDSGGDAGGGGGGE